MLNATINANRCFCCLSTEGCQIGQRQASFGHLTQQQCCSGSTHVFSQDIEVFEDLLDVIQHACQKDTGMLSSFKPENRFGF